MGMFDTVWVPCPQCGERAKAQSKLGPCELKDYHMETAPLDVLAGLIHDHWTCEKCGTRFLVAVQSLATTVRDLQEEA
jgi:hypothetical protein